MANTILDKLSDYAKYRVSQNKKLHSYEDIRREAESLQKGNFEFELALKNPGLSFICECKKASPSKGLISPDFPFLEIAKSYEEAGADCISVLTEPKWFLGSDDYLKAIAENVKIPCIRKDFTVDEYMIFEAKLLGAKAVLLICSILDKSQLKEYLAICDTLGISALVEAHDENEIETSLDISARIIGVNNRNLKNFSIDTNNSRKLRKLVPGNVLFVSESGISSPEDIKSIKDFGADAVLIGEYLMKCEDKKKLLSELKMI
ncbi:MAG: indole-3-glycerol phosphate synthase TrpC [Butyrivibrio sp.]|nr:indole-3-glycerol phosphate synthase TrpC [bacterium]MBQ9590886.1 indole-3-glycerol phosphate synthase TrpC [Butyrivibrio sp.]